MKLNINTLLGSVVLGALIVGGCAKSSTDTTNEKERDYIEMWLKKYYPDYQMQGKGIYVIDSRASSGFGEAYDGQFFAMISYTTKSLSGEISTTTEANVAKQLGTYDKTYYYGPSTLLAGFESLSPGVEDLLTGMRKGEHKTAVIPNWLMGSKRYASDKEYMEHTVKNATTTIYDVTLVDFTNDITKYQIDSIKSYCTHQYGSIPDSLQYGFYYRELTAPTDTNAYKNGNKVYINYTGKLLNGQVFDTTVKEVAMESGIFSASKTYEPTYVTWADKATDITMGSSSSSLIEGFKQLLWKMRKGGKSEGLFISEYGYSYSGSGKQIPAYSPLIFEIEIVEK